VFPTVRQSISILCDIFTYFLQLFHHEVSRQALNAILGYFEHLSAQRTRHVLAWSVGAAETFDTFQAVSVQASRKTSGIVNVSLQMAHSVIRHSDLVPFGDGAELPVPDAMRFDNVRFTVGLFWPPYISTLSPAQAMSTLYTAIRTHPAHHMRWATGCIIVMCCLPKINRHKLYLEQNVITVVE